MVETMDYLTRYQELERSYDRDCILRDKVQSTANSYQFEIDRLNSEIEICDKAAMLLTTVSVDAKRAITKFLEDIVSDALKFISEKDYTFEIEIDDTGKSIRCEFYVVETINGKTSRQKPQDSCGGGFVDIISTTLRYAYLNLYSPKLNGPIILDEPSKMVSQEMSIKFAEFIKRLGEDFGKQTILVTHNQSLTNAADNTIIITK